MNIAARARTLTDPTQLSDIYTEGGFDALIEIAWHNPNLEVVRVLVERVHGRDQRWFSGAAAGLSRFDVTTRIAHLDRALRAEDRESPIGRARIEAVCRRIEDDPQLHRVFRERLDREKTPRIAKELMWSLVHGDSTSRDGCQAIVRAIARFNVPAFRKEAARALKYWDEASRRPVLRAFLDAQSDEERVSLRAFARLCAAPSVR